MERVALFSKITYEEYEGALSKIRALDKERIRKIYESIQKPIRATSGSGGYDFFLLLLYQLGSTLKYPMDGHLIFIQEAVLGLSIT